MLAERTIKLNIHGMGGCMTQTEDRCTACCTVMGVYGKTQDNDLLLEKEAGSPCPLIQTTAKPHGCGDYDNRPGCCSNYHCENDVLTIIDPTSSPLQSQIAQNRIRFLLYVAEQNGETTPELVTQALNELGLE